MQNILINYLQVQTFVLSFKKVMIEFNSNYYYQIFIHFNKVIWEDVIVYKARLLIHV